VNKTMLNPSLCVNDQSLYPRGSRNASQPLSRTAPLEAVLRIKHRFLSLLGVLVLSLALPHTAWASPNLVQNGGFETGDFTGWSLSGDTGSALVSNNDPHSGQFAANFDPVGDYLYLSQDLSTTPGLNYSLFFWPKWVDYPIDHIQVFWNGALVFDQANSTSYPWTETSVNNLLATSGQTELTFAFMAGDSQSLWSLDDVSVTAQSTTPEPGSIMLLGTGILGIAGMLRRKLV
jgi:PEP-CTERM motif